MAASTVFDRFLVEIIVAVDAAITIGDITVMPRPGFVSIYYWSVAFTYITGAPAATAFRLSSADGLTGTFSPGMPEGYGSGIKYGILSGTVQIVPGVTGDVTYNGTITIIQA